MTLFLCLKYIIVDITLRIQCCRVAVGSGTFCGGRQGVTIGAEVVGFSIVLTTRNIIIYIAIAIIINIIANLFVWITRNALGGHSIDAPDDSHCTSSDSAGGGAALLWLALRRDHTSTSVGPWGLAGAGAAASNRARA